MFIHDIIKIKYIELGYLQNYRYSMISDDEMFQAFYRYFDDNYPCLDPELEDEYNTLVAAIQSHIVNYQASGEAIPDWVYSFMLGSVISINSEYADLEELCTLLNLKEVPPEFNAELAAQCYKISSEWIRKLPTKYEDRPPTVFGELHVMKSLRLQNVDVIG